MHTETTYVPRGYRAKATFKNNAKKNVKAPHYCSDYGLHLKAMRTIHNNLKSLYLNKYVTIENNVTTENNTSSLSD